MKRIAQLVVALTMLASLAWAGDPYSLTYEWTPPTTGTAVHHYIVEISNNGTDWVPAGTVIANEITLAFEYGQSYYVRVAGVDAGDRQGPYSQPSDEAFDNGPPGGCGKPFRK